MLGLPIDNTSTSQNEDLGTDGRMDEDVLEQYRIGHHGTGIHETEVTEYVARGRRMGGLAS